MRTKTLLLTAALGAAGVATSMAQVYSQNAVGYINVTVPPGFSMIANQLIPASSTLPALFPSPPPGTSIYKFNGTFTISTFDEFTLEWNNPTETLDFGGGAFILNPQATPFTVTFVGEVAQGNPVANPFPAGFSIRSSKIPHQGLITTDLNFQPQPGDSIYQFDPTVQNFAISTYDPFDLVWTGPAVGGQPTIKIGESFFFLTTAAGSWNRNFTVN